MSHWRVIYWMQNKAQRESDARAWHESFIIECSAYHSTPQRIPFLLREGGALM